MRGRRNPQITMLAFIDLEERDPGCGRLEVTRAQPGNRINGHTTRPKVADVETRRIAHRHTGPTASGSTRCRPASAPPPPPDRPAPIPG